jgi:Spy/CpxP family protein refolding chaperone
MKIAKRRLISWPRILVTVFALSVSASALSQPYGYGHGQGMMGPGMMGPAMMGPGMMGMGPGMMGPGAYSWIPDLSDAQRKQIAQIQDDWRAQQTDLALKLNEEQARLQSLWYAGKRDPAQLREQNRKVYDLQREIADAMRDAHLKMDGVLSKEQRDRLSRQGGWGWGYGWR